MRFSIIALVATTALYSTPAAAQGDEVLRGAMPGWVQPSAPIALPDNPQGVVYVRRSDTQVHFDDEGQLTYVGQRFHILNSQGLQAGNVGLVWNPAVGSPTVHGLKVHRDGSVIDVLQDNEFEILRREDQLEQAMLDGMLTAVLRVPDLRVGDELEFDYTTRSNDPTLGSDSFGVLFLADSPPPGRFHLALSWEEGQEPLVRMTDDFGVEAQRSDRRLALEMDDPAIINPPSNAPPRYNWTRILQYSDFKDWTDVSKRFHQLYEATSRLDANSPLKAEAARIVSAHDSDFARAAAALKLVQQEVRYIYVGLNGGNQSPASADLTWQRRYGDCKGKTVMLLALLDEMGIDAEPVMVSNLGADDGLDLRLPSPGQFDHVLVRATIDGKAYWLDGTLPAIAVPSATPELPYRWVLPLSAKGKALEKIDWIKPKLPLKMVLIDIDASEGFDAPARMKQTSVKRGLEGMGEYLQISAIPLAQLENSLRNSLTSSGDWDSVEEVSYRYDQASKASILTISGMAPVDWDDDGDGAYSMTLPGGGFYAPQRLQRAQGQDMDAPYYQSESYSCHVTTVHFPKDTKVENWAFNTFIDTMLFNEIYYRSMERHADGSLRMVRGSRVEELEISPQKAARDNGRIEGFDNSMASLEYDPNHDNVLADNMPKVPAVNEIDWLAKDAPCLPPDVMKEK